MYNFISRLFTRVKRVLLLISVFIKNNKILSLLCVLILLTIIGYSPLFSLNWVYLGTLVFLVKAQYRNIGLLWGFYFTSWYMLFCMLLIKHGFFIIIGGNDTAVVLANLEPIIKAYPCLYNLAIETTFLMHFLSGSLGMKVYIPSFLGIFYKILRLFVSTAFMDGVDDDESSKPSSADSNIVSPGLTPSDIQTKHFFKEPLESSQPSEPLESSQPSKPFSNLKVAKDITCEDLSRKTKTGFFKPLGTAYSENADGNGGKIVVECRPPLLGKVKVCAELEGFLYKISKRAIKKDTEE